MRQILVFILFAALLCWIMFSPIYKHAIIMRQALLQKEVDYLLEVGCSDRYGYINADMVEASKERLGKRGFNPNDLVYEVTTTNGSSGMDAFAPVARGEGIQLVISYPYGEMFTIDTLLGLSQPSSEQHMAALGMKMSEYVP